MSWLFLALACGGANSADDSGAGALCVDAPVLTWENFGEGFLRENCESCHGSEAPYRQSTSAPPPADIHFGDKDSALRLKDQILSSAAGAAPRMPPRGGVGVEDREKLNIWLRCWETK